MIDKLPYELTAGVTAAREGLVIEADINPIAHYVLDGPELVSGPKCVIPWPDVAERLLYRKGKPWCAVTIDDCNGGIHCYTDDITGLASPQDESLIGINFYLDRLAAILCNDAVAFRVLYWCLTEYGDKDD